MVSTVPLPVAVDDIAALSAVGTVRPVGNYPLHVACRVETHGGAESIWVDIGYPSWFHRQLWQAVYQRQSIPPGHEIKSLVHPVQARRQGAKLARLGIVPVDDTNSRFDGRYVLTSVRHSARP